MVIIIEAIRIMQQFVSPFAALESNKCYYNMRTTTTIVITESKSLCAISRLVILWPKLIGAADRKGIVGKQFGESTNR